MFSILLLQTAVANGKINILENNGSPLCTFDKESILVRHSSNFTIILYTL